MSFQEDEFNELIKAYKERRWDDLCEMLKNYDPESVKAAEKYLGVKFDTSFPVRVGTGQGKMKKYTKPHSKKWYSKKIKQAKTKEEKQFWKAAKSARLKELERVKQKVKYQRTQARIQKNKIFQKNKFIRERESLKRQARRYGIKVPKTALLSNKRFKYISSRIKVLKKSNSTLRKIIRNKKRK